MNSQTATASSLPRSRNFLADVSNQNRCAMLILAITLVWTMAALVVQSIYPDISGQGKSAVGDYLPKIAINTAVFLYIAGIIYVFKSMHAAKDIPAATLFKTMITRDPMAMPKLLAKAGLGIATFALFTFAFAIIKTRIPEMVPYSWDARFMEWDRVLFFGRDPWTVFAWMYDFPPLIHAMDFLYDIWAMLLIGTWTLCFVMTKPSAAVRFRLPLALLIAWFVGGNLMAT